MNNLRFRALMFAAFFLLSSVVPVRPARAVVVPLVGLAVSALSSTGAVVSADILTAGVTSLIGGSIVALAITPSTADAPMRVALSSDKATIDSVMPPPVAPPTAASVGGQAGLVPPPASSGKTCQTKSDPSVPGGTIEPCDVCVIDYAPLESGRCCLELQFNPATNSYDKTGVIYNNETMASSPGTCPAGYSSSGSGCVLADARQAVTDNKVDVMRSPSGWIQGGDRDPVPVYSSAPSPNGFSVYGVNSAGRQVMLQMSVGADGTTTLNTYTLDETASNSMVRTGSIAVSSSGVVQAASVQTTPGTMAPSQTVPGTGTVTTTGSATEPLVLPTDYARVGEAAAAAGLLTPKLDQLHKDLTDVGALPVDPVAPDSSAFRDAFFSGTFGGLLSWRLPNHNSECPVAVFDYTLFGSHQHLVMDAHCTITEQIRPSLSVVMVVFWTITALFVLLGA